MQQKYLRYRGRQRKLEVLKMMKRLLHWALAIVLCITVASLFLACGYLLGVRDATDDIQAWAVDQGLAEWDKEQPGLLIWHTAREEPQPLPIWLRVRDE